MRDGLVAQPRVPLRGCHGGMSQYLLKRRKAPTLLQPAARKGVPKLMRVKALNATQPPNDGTERARLNRVERN